jgi:hypothetical protein
MPPERKMRNAGMWKSKRCEERNSKGIGKQPGVWVMSQLYEIHSDSTSHSKRESLE